jgi:hypothetical protein
MNKWKVQEMMNKWKEQGGEGMNEWKEHEME